MTSPISEDTVVHVAPSQEKLDKLPSNEEQPRSDETVRMKEERQTTPSSPRRNGIPPKRSLATARRLADTTSSPATISTTSSVSRGSPGSLSKRPTRPTTSVIGRRPPTSVTAATAASSGHRLRASITSSDDVNKPGTSSGDENKKQAIGRLTVRNAITGPMAARSPAIKSLPSSTDRRSILGTAASIERQNGARAGSLSPTKSTLRPTTNNARPSNVTTAARSARPTAISSRGTFNTATSGLPKKRLNTIPASPATARSNVVASDSDSSAPAAVMRLTRPTLSTRKSNMSVTIEQRLREMEAVNQMLRAAMAEDGDESDEVKEEYGKKVDEGLASLRLKLQEARLKEAEEGMKSAPANGMNLEVDETKRDRSTSEKTPSHPEVSEAPRPNASQLQMALAGSQEKVHALEAEVEALQTKRLEYSKSAAEVSKDVQEATENIRREYTLKIKDIFASHTSEINTLRARLEEEKANTDIVNALKADIASERAKAVHTSERLEQALSDISALESLLKEQRRTYDEAIKERDRALDVKDQDILILQEELQELQDTQSRELDDLKSVSLQSSSALESEIATLRSNLVEAEDSSLSASARHEQFSQAKDREIEGMHQIIESLQDELQLLREIKERELDSHRIRLVQEHESVLESLKAEHQTALDGAQLQNVEAAQSTRLAHENEIQDLLREHDIVQGDLQNSLAEIVASKTDLEADLESTKAGHVNELSGYQAKLERSEQLLNESKTAQQEASKAAEQLKEQINALGLERDEAKTAHTDFQNDLEKASGEVASLRKVLETFDNESKNKDEQHASALKKLKDDAAILAKTLDQTNSEISSAKETHSSALQALRDSHGKEIEELKTTSERKHDDAIKTLQSQYDELRHTLKEANEQHAASLKKMKTEHSEALEHLKVEHSQALETPTKVLDRVNVNHSEDLEKLKTALSREHNTAVQEMQSERNKMQEMLKEAKEQHPAALERLETEHSKALKKHSEVLDEVQKAHSKDIEEQKLRLEREHAMIKQKMEANNANEISETEKKHLLDLEALRAEQEQKLTRLRKDLKDERIQSTSELHKAHEAALSELRLEIEQQKEAMIQAKHELQAAQDNTKDSQDHEALLAELKIELEQAASVKKELESTLQHITMEKDDVVPVVGELENLKRDLPIAKAEAEQHREAVDAANDKIKELAERLAAANAEAEDHKTKHKKTLAELSSLQSEIAKTNATASEVTVAEALQIKQDLEAMQKAGEAEKEQNSKLKARLQKAEEAAEQHTIRFREVEAALKVTTAELTEMQTKRADGSEFVASPATKGTMRLSRWRAGSPSKNGGNGARAEGEELGPRIEGTVGLPFYLR
ncbi:MAG: hypothetical protein LQ347_004841 [Umbilicaria vellea]|nr:MAG: hypothetical protein LQ347_004841 [Umbilicaria vellea]